MPNLLIALNKEIYCLSNIWTFVLICYYSKNTVKFHCLTAPKKVKVFCAIESQQYCGVKSSLLHDLFGSIFLQDVSTPVTLAKWVSWIFLFDGKTICGETIILMAKEIYEWHLSQKSSTKVHARDKLKNFSHARNKQENHSPEI